MARVLTPGERQLVADHARAAARTAGRLAVFEVGCVALGLVLGHGMGLLIVQSARILGGRR